MSYEPDELEAERLKQILFPRKTRASRTSSLEQSKLVEINYNQQMNSKLKYNMKQQIIRLKEGIKNFMQKQPISQNLLTTPRQCLQLIKCMSERMVNYTQEIQQAVYTLIESIPKPLPKALQSSKYFLMHLKLCYLNSIFQVKRKVSIGACFTTMRKIYQQEKLQAQKQHENYLASQLKNQIFVTNKMHMAFNRWRRNTAMCRKIQLQNYLQQHNFDKPLKIIHMLSDEGRMALYFQRTFETNADAVQIVLYNSKNQSLRSYQPESQILTSQFESVHNQSQSQPLSITRDPMCWGRETKIKQLQLPLTHSLTKICLVKKQVLKVENMHRDPDYASVDDYTAYYGKTYRQSSQTANSWTGCIFVPILHKNNCIGVLRLYYYGRMGDIGSLEYVSTIAEVLDNCIKTSNIFQNYRERSQQIRSLSLLKSIQILTKIQNIQIENLSQKQAFLQQNYNERTQQLICNYFPLKYLKQYSFKVMESLERGLKYKITASSQDKQNDTEMQKCAITALCKMTQTQSSYIYYNQLVYIKTDSNIYIYKYQTNQNQHANQAQRIATNRYSEQLCSPRLPQSETAEHRKTPHIPTELVKTILVKSEQIKQAKQREIALLNKQKQRMQLQQQNNRMAALKKNIYQYCNTYARNRQLTQFTNTYIQKFINTQAITYTLSIKTKQIQRQSQGHILYQDNHLQIMLLPQYPSCPPVPQYIVSPLATITQTVINKLAIPRCVDVQIGYISMHAIMYKYCSTHTIQQSITHLISHILHIDSASIQHYPIQASDNIYEQCTYIAYIASNQQFHSPKALIMGSHFNPTSAQCLTTRFSTLICLSNCLLVLIKDHYVSVEGWIVEKVAGLYGQFKQEKRVIMRNQIEGKRRINVANAIFIVAKFVYAKNKLLCNAFMNVKAYRKCRYMPNVLHNYIHRENLKLLNYAISTFKKQLPRKKKQSASKTLQCLHKLVYVITKPHYSQLIARLNELHKIPKIVSKMCAILNNQVYTQKYVAFQRIYYKNYTSNVNPFMAIQTAVNRKLISAWISLVKNAKLGQAMAIVQDQSQCAIVTKMDQLTKIGAIVGNKFTQYKVYLYMINGSYLCLTCPCLTVYSQLPQSSCSTYIEFPSSHSPSSSSSALDSRLIKSTIWELTSAPITLIQKHYLQVLSRAIEEGYLKFIYKNQHFCAFINQFQRKNNTKMIMNAWEELRDVMNSKIRGQQYRWRDCYYESSIQTQNYTITLTQIQKQQNQRSQQMSQSSDIKKSLCNQLAEHRKSIIRLQISSRQLEQSETKTRLQNDRNQMKRLFSKWRIEVGYMHKYDHRKIMGRKRRSGAVKAIANIIGGAVNRGKEQGFRIIIVHGVNCKINSMGYTQCIHQNRDPNLNYNQNILNKHNNRLLTFQDELNQFATATKQLRNELRQGCSSSSNKIQNENERQQKQQKQVSIIPISFKHFETSNNKQNYDVTDQDVKKMNGGAYKLNTKTLKFLKRMGKINN